jgi:hypothetical protein
LRGQQVEALVDAHRLLERRELSELGDELGVVLGFQRILVLELRDQELEERVAAHRLTAGLGGERLAEGRSGGAGVVIDS